MRCGADLSYPLVFLSFTQGRGGEKGGEGGEEGERVRMKGLLFL